MFTFFILFATIILLLQSVKIGASNLVEFQNGYSSNYQGDDICRYHGVGDDCNRFYIIYNSTNYIQGVAEVDYDYQFFGSTSDNDFARGYEYYHCADQAAVQNIAQIALLNPSDTQDLFTPGNVCSMNGGRWGVDVVGATFSGFSPAMCNQIETAYSVLTNGCQDYWAAIRRGWIWTGYAFAGIAGLLAIIMLYVVLVDRYKKRQTRLSEEIISV